VPGTPDFLNLFVQPPGDLLYYLTVFVLSVISVLMALGHRLRHPESRTAQRYVAASVAIVVVWFVVMSGALIALLSNQTSDALLPPMERAAHILTVLFAGWAFITADSDRWGRAGNLALLGILAVIIIGYVITGVEWAGSFVDQDFNLTSGGSAWSFITLLLSVLGFILTLAYIHLVRDAPLKLVFFLVLIAGNLATIIQIGQGVLIGDYPGPSRLAFMAALLFLPAILYRMIIAGLEAALLSASRTSSAAAISQMPSPTATSVVPMVPPPAAVPAPPTTLAGAVAERESAQLMKALGMMLEQATPDNIPERILNAALTVLKADVGALLTTQDANYADITTGLDKVMSRSVTGISINLEEQPTLQNAIERRLQRPLFTDRNADELRDLYTRMDISSVGPTYFQPLVSNRELRAVLLIGLPYTQRELTDAEQELLKGIGIIAASLLALSHAARDSRLQAEERVIEAMVKGVPLDAVETAGDLSALELLRDELTSARDQIATLNQQVTELKIQLDDERSRVALSLGDTEEGKSISQRVIALNEEQQRILEERERLSARLREAETALASATTDDDTSVFKTMVEALRKEKEDLLAQRDRLQTLLDEFRAASAESLPEAMKAMLDQLTQDKARTEAERDAFAARLTDIEAQLQALGVQDGATGLAQIIGQLREQRAALQARYDALKLERDALVNERGQFSKGIQQEQERDSQLLKLQADVTHLAADREALTKQRDSLRAERDEIQARMEALKDQQARLMAEVAAFEQELTENHEEQNELREQIEALANERSELARERDRLTAEKHALEMEREQLLARFEGDRDRIARLGDEGVGSLTRMIDEITTQRAELERELNEARSAIEALEDRLEILQLRAGQAQPQIVYRSDDPEQFLGMIQELRTPMTSIVGYVDLVLNESAGILGEMQRKFMQRVHANVARLASMLDDLIRISILDAGRFTLSRSPIDMIELIEDAITSASPQLREKGLSIHLSLEEDAPPVSADRDAMGQVIGQLLTNAYLVSPAGSDVYVSARHVAEGQEVYGHTPRAESLLISVEDSGGGIAPEDIPRVFARKYKAENPLVQGLGDTGVGLAIAKALVEAHDGEVWLDTREGVGSVFSFTIPIAAVAELER
jgi:C4-dicarboxylate-specific signal transduction histidine kinase